MKNISYNIFLFLLLFSSVAKVSAQAGKKTAEDLDKEIGQMVVTSNATIGVAVYNLDDKKEFIIHNEKHQFPMMSVYKLPLAMAVLKSVDEGKLSLGQKIPIRKKDLKKNTWSPLRDKYPNGNISLTIAELLYYTVSLSDNNTCDILLHVMNGPEKVNSYIQGIAGKGIVIGAYEFQMARKWEAQYINRTNPGTMITILQHVYSGKEMSDSSRRFLLNLMTESSNSTKRIKGDLPEGTVVAHKTGTSNTNDKGMTAAVNDVGIITMPNGKHIAVAIFVSDTMERFETNEKIIAALAKKIYDYYLNP